MPDTEKHDKWHSDPDVDHVQRDGWIWDDEKGWHPPTEEEKAALADEKSDKD